MAPGFDLDGYIPVSGNMHNQHLIYFKIENIMISIALKE
jgi:hypothetical protein